MRGQRGRRGEQPMVPEATFDSYYGKPVLNAPVWEPRDIAGYLFLGGPAGASSALGAGAHATGRTALARASKVGAAGAGWSRWPPSSTIWGSPGGSCTCCGCSR